MTSHRPTALDSADLRAATGDLEADLRGVMGPPMPPSNPHQSLDELRRSISESARELGKLTAKADKRRDEARAFFEGKRGNPWAYQRHSSGALTLTDHGVREWRK